VGELVKEIWIDASPEKVFPYLVEPELLTKWLATSRGTIRAPAVSSA